MYENVVHYIVGRGYETYHGETYYATGDVCYKNVDGTPDGEENTCFREEIQRCNICNVEK